MGLVPGTQELSRGMEITHNEIGRGTENSADFFMSLQIVHFGIV